MGCYYVSKIAFSFCSRLCWHIFDRSRFREVYSRPTIVKPKGPHPFFSNHSSKYLVDIYTGNFHPERCVFQFRVSLCKVNFVGWTVKQVLFYWWILGSFVRRISWLLCTMHLGVFTLGIWSIPSRWSLLCSEIIKTLVFDRVPSSAIHPLGLVRVKFTDSFCSGELLDNCRRMSEHIQDLPVSSDCCLFL